MLDAKTPPWRGDLVDLAHIAKHSMHVKWKWKIRANCHARETRPEIAYWARRAQARPRSYVSVACDPPTEQRKLTTQNLLAITDDFSKVAYQPLEEKLSAIAKPRYTNKNTIRRTPTSWQNYLSSDVGKTPDVAPCASSHPRIWLLKAQNATEE